jgi:hypothetical protein
VKARPTARSAFKDNAGAVLLRNPRSQAEPETCAAVRTARRGWYAIEALEDTGVMLRSYSNAGVFYCEQDLIRLF